MATADGKSVTDKINDVTNLVGTLVPAVASIGNMIRLVATAVRPSDAQKAQAFDAAIAELDAKVSALNSSIAEFDNAKAQAAANASKPTS